MKLELGVHKREDGPEDGAVERLPLSGVQDALDHALSQGEDGAVLAVNAMIAQAVLHDASDLYCEPWKDGVAIRLRLDGVLHDVARIESRHQDRIVARIKVLSNLVSYEKGLPQDGRIDASHETLERSLRVSIYPTIYGEKAVIRILDSAESLPELDALGFSDDVLSGLRSWTDRPQGTLLLTGPSASGKTTTIYALLRELLRQPTHSRHVVTIEDPVEYRLDGITQSQVHAGQGFTYDVGLRAILRQDPDVLMVGEIRDSETAHVAVKAGLTGHLVVSTLHSSSAAGVFSRLLDMGLEPYLLASSISGVLAQRLVRRNCPQCSTAHIPEARQTARFGLSGEDISFVKGVGCKACNNIGYTRRTAMGEWMSVTEEISDLMLRRSPTGAIQDAAISAGMKTLFDAGVDLVRNGVTTLDELQLAVYPEDYVS